MIQSCRLTCLFYCGRHSCSILQDPCSVLLMEADSPSRHTADVSNVSITAPSLQYTLIYRAVSSTAVLPCCRVACLFPTWPMQLALPNNLYHTSFIVMITPEIDESNWLNNNMKCYHMSRTYHHLLGNSMIYSTSV